MFFLTYLIVGAIQMGANIDYAIVVSNRYITLREKNYGKRESITAAVNGALPTLLTSGSILATAGLLIGLISSEALSSNIGIALGRGTVISLALVLLVLPQILLWGDKFIAKTSFRHKTVGLKIISHFEENDFEALARKEASQGGVPSAKSPRKNSKSQ